MNQQEVNPGRRRRRTRIVVGLVGTMGAMMLIGFGGLAAWTVTTQNNGSTFATGSVHHSNQATISGGSAVNCTDLTSPASCGAIFTLANAKPGSSTSGTVKIVNTGTLTSTFALGLVSAVGSGPALTPICSDLTVSIVDNEGTPATVYSGSLSAFTSAGIKQTGGSLNWAAADTGTYTFTVTLPVGISNLLDQGATCTAAFNWTQTNT